MAYLCTRYLGWCFALANAHERLVCHKVNERPLQVLGASSSCEALTRVLADQLVVEPDGNPRSGNRANIPRFIRAMLDDISGRFMRNAPHRRADDNGCTYVCYRIQEGAMPSTALVELEIGPIGLLRSGHGLGSRGHTRGNGGTEACHFRLTILADQAIHLRVRHSCVVS